MQFHDSGYHPAKKSLYVRSAYRNDPEFRITRLQRQGDLLDLMPFGRMIDNDAAVGRNYQRLASQGLVDLYVGGQQHLMNIWRRVSGLCGCHCSDCSQT